MSSGPPRPVDPQDGGRSATGACGDDELVPPVAASEPHLLDTDLGAQLTMAQSKHLTNCGWCQERLTNSQQHPDLTDEDAFMAIARSRINAGAGAALGELTKLRPALHELTSERATRDDVQAGQLWRLRWDDTSELAAVLAVDRWWVTVAPVTSDTAAADEYSVLLAPDVTCLDIPLALCVSLECTVPLFTLDTLIAQTGTESRTTPATGMPSAHVLQAIWRAWRRGDVPPEDARYGEPMLGGDLDRRELRNTVSAAFVPLVSAAPTILRDTVQPSTSLVDMIDNLNLSLSELVEASQLDRKVFLQIKQGGRVTAQDAHQLATLLNTDVNTVVAANPPLDEGLIMQISRPRWRHGLRRLARKSRTTEDEARWRVAEMAAEARLRTVPRATQGLGDPSVKWESIVQMCLDAAIGKTPASDYT
jgi:hypothetical protein